MARVRQFREANGLTQEKFAEQAGLDYKYYQHVEAGRKPNLGMQTLLKLAKGTRRELWELLKFDDTPLAVTEPKGNEFTALPRKNGRPRKRVVGEKETWAEGLQGKLCCPDSCHPVDTTPAVAHCPGVDKKPHRAEEPKAAYPAKKPLAAAAAGSPSRQVDEATAKRITEKIFSERKELLRKLAQ